MAEVTEVAEGKVAAHKSYSAADYLIPLFSSGKATVVKVTALPSCPASARRIHPLPFGPPSQRGNGLLVIFTMVKNEVRKSLPLQPLGEGARQRRRMD